MLSDLTNDGWEVLIADAAKVEGLAPLAARPAGFMSHNHIDPDPDLAVDVFGLEPLPRPQ